MPKVLLIDDEEPIRTLFAKLLEKRGLTVVTADSAASGIARLAEETPDAVITDLRMETPLAGFQVVQAAALLVPRPTIVVLTAFPVPASDWKGAGADALLVKGSSVGTLISNIVKLVTSRSQSSRASG